MLIVLSSIERKMLVMVFLFSTFQLSYFEHFQVFLLVSLILKHFGVSVFRIFKSVLTSTQHKAQCDHTT